MPNLLDAFVPQPPLNRGALGFQLLDHGDNPCDSTTSTHQSLETRLQAVRKNSLPIGNSKSSPYWNEDTNRPVVSSVDATAWNLPEPLAIETAASTNRASSSSSSSSSSRFSRPPLFSDQVPMSLCTMASLPTSPASDETVVTTTSIPWVPNANDIESLTVVQLKQEMSARALKKTGNKYDLQQRFKEWCHDQQHWQRLLSRGAAHNNDLTELNLRTAYSVAPTTTTTTSSSSSNPPTPTFQRELLSWGIDTSPLLDHSSGTQPTPNRRNDDSRLKVDSLAEWARTVDLKPLLNRREAIHREKLQGKAVPKKSLALADSIQPSEYLTVLKKMFDQPSSPYSNREVKQMYAAAKHADQMGNRELTKRILLELKTATPNDARIYRRLARLEQEDGQVAAARAVLQEGLRLHPDNSFLWHGLGQLEGSVGNEALQKEYWEKAMAVDPTIPHSYHALGTLEHAKGRIANAMCILKRGLEYCPTNHRLHHALGDLYRDAKMLSMAASSYLKAIKYGPVVSHGFAYTALAYVAYEEGQVERCRRWLHKAVQLNNGRHANGWVSLAQFEESEGRIDAARSACIAGIGQYERGLLARYSSVSSPTAMTNHSSRVFLEDPVALKNNFLKTVPSYRSGDRFFNVYRNWLRLEERHGTLDSVEEVYQRASVAFRHEYKLALDMASYFARLNIPGRAHQYFAEACVRAGAAHADPYRLFAEFEYSNRNFLEARRILYSGVVALTQSDSQEEHPPGLVELFLAWGVCEWQLNNLFHAQKLLQHALHLSAPPSGVSRLRALILFVLARFEHFRGEHQRAQHYIGLCLTEHGLPGASKAQVWDLWALVAHEMGASKLAVQCQEQAARTHQQGDQTLGTDAVDSIGAMNGLQGPDGPLLLRRDPWHYKIFGASNDAAADISKWMALLPKRKATAATRTAAVPVDGPVTGREVCLL
jgi:tetratricopeptide (TPR) repeat protein